MAERDSYKATLFDREGPDAGIKIKAYGYAMIAGTASFGGLAYAGMQLHLSLVPYLALILIVPPVLTVVVAKVALRGMESVETGVQNILAGGSSTPYAEQHSYQQALVMQGRLDEALESYEAIIAEPGSTIEVRLTAAELYTRQAGRHERAAELFREVTRHPACTQSEEAYAANRLADVLSGPLKQPGRALVELRRLAERHPNTQAAQRARNAIRTLKALQAEQATTTEV
jgi:hypothetical protein